MARVARWVTIVGVLGWSACGDVHVAGDADAEAVAPDGGGADAATPAGIEWAPCPFYTYGEGDDAECATVDVPIDWDDPDGDRLPLFVKRLGDVDTPGQQLWFLMGGPGGASHGYESLAETLLGADPSLDVYLMDHRGTGRSARLGCPAQEATASDGGWAITMDEWPACIASLRAQWGDALDHFSTTMAARDLGWMIEQTRAPGQWVHVHGGSYGTFWAQRYLQIFPGQPTSVSMLGVVHPEFSFTKYNEHYELVGGQFLEACGADAFCAGKLGADPVATFREVMGDIGGHCPAALAAGLDRDTLRGFFGSQLIWGWYERVLPLAIVYRIQRCDPADVTALQYFAANMVDPLDGLRNDRLFSSALGNHIGLSDLWEPPIPTVEEAEALLAEALWSFGSTARLQLAEIWPTYPPDAHHNEFANTDVPVLLLQGTYDPASPLYQAIPVGEHFDGPNQHFVELPGASHSWTSPTSEGYSCAINVFFNFLLDPTAELLACTDIMLPLDFTGPSDVASLLGTTDLWENPSSAAAVTADPAALRRARDNYARYLRGER